MKAGVTAFREPSKRVESPISLSARASAPSTSARPPSAPGNTELTCSAGDRVAADRLPDGPEDELSGLGEIAAEDHSARVQQIAEIRDSTPDMSADVGDHPTAARITVPRQPDHAFHGQVRPVAGLEERQHIARRRKGLQAAAVAATAHGAGFIKSNMPDFSRCATRAAVDLPVDHQARADTARDLDVREVPDPAPAPPDHLAERAQVGVVVHVHGHAEPPPQLLGGPRTGPARQDRGGPEGPRLHVDRTRHTEPHTRDLGPVDTGCRDQATDQLLGPVEALRGRGVHVQRLGLLRQHLMGQIPDRDAQMGVTEVDPDDDAGCPRSGTRCGPCARPPKWE